MMNHCEGFYRSLSQYYSECRPLYLEYKGYISKCFSISIILVDVVLRGDL